MSKTTKPGPKPLLELSEKTLKEIRKFAGFLMTQEEIAMSLNVSRSTFTAFIAKHPEAKEAIEDGHVNFKASLRRIQAAHAVRNAAMAIFLGKNYLGQTDKQDMNLSGTIDLNAIRDALNKKVKK